MSSLRAKALQIESRPTFPAGNIGQPNQTIDPSALLLGLDGLRDRQHALGEVRKADIGRIDVLVVLVGLLEVAGLFGAETELVDDLLLEIVHRRDGVASRFELHDGHVGLTLLEEAHREVVERPETVLRGLLRELEMLQRLIVVLVGEILDAELVAKVQVVRIALDALREVIEDELVLLPFEIGDTFLVALGAALPFDGKPL